MRLKQWDKALPYAEAAAQTWAGWAMLCASECNEGMGNWEQAELWARRTSERYPESWSQWFLFCKRTGHGDLKAAQEHAEQYLQTYGLEEGGDFLAANFFYLLVGEPKKALKGFRSIFDRSIAGPPHTENMIIAGLQVAMLADELDNPVLRDSALEQVCKFPEMQKLKSLAILEMFRAALVKGQSAPLDLDAVDRVLDEIEGFTRGNVAYHVAVFLRKHATPEQAKKYFQLCADIPNGFPWFRMIALDRLRTTNAGNQP
jgi:hypothetical protein